MTVGMNYCEDRFRAVSMYATKNGFGGAFPTFNEADYGMGKVYGVWLLKNGVAEFRDVSASELGNPQTPMDRFRAVNFYAYKNGYGGAFPTFYEADYGKGKVYGVWLLKKDAAEFRDIPANELGNPTNVEERFRAVNLYAYNNGYGGAFPTFNEADYGKGKVYGAWLFKKDAAEFRDVLFYDLLKLIIRPGDIIYGWSAWPGHVGIIINEMNDLFVREAYPDNGVSTISLKDFCEGGGYHKTAQKGKSGQNYTRIEIFRAKCSDELAKFAVENAKSQEKGMYDYSYLSVVLPPLYAATIALWTEPDLWYCSKFVYKMYRRAGLDLYPQLRTCLNPLMWPFLDKRLELPYLYAECPWYVITPKDITTSEYVFPIWGWSQ